jgi:hypothetical protein
MYFTKMGASLILKNSIYRKKEESEFTFYTRVVEMTEEK